MGKICHSRKRVDKLECKMLTALVDGKPEAFDISDGDHDYEWKFVAGKLYQVNVTPHASLSFENESRLLTDEYGQPTHTSTVIYQNSYGAKWECPEMSWDMPDGTSIDAREYIGTDYDSAPIRQILVIFLSKNAIEDAARKAQPKSNPYSSPQ